MLNKNVVNFIGCDSEYEDAQIVMFGAPFTTSYRPGARFGASAIRNESYGLETYSPYQDKDLADTKVFDSGDLELSIGDSEKVLETIEDRTAQILKDEKLPLMLGGEHLVTLGAFRAALKKYPDLYIVHFDAHTDLREDYLGVKLSHASVIKRCWDLIGDNHIFQFGIRSGEKYEFDWAKERTYLNKFNFNTLDEIIEKLKGKKVYFTLDLDVLDPSIFAGTGTPEAGGVTFMELLHAVIKVCSKLDVVALDVNELCPIYDMSGVSTAVACKIVREILLALS